MRLKALGLACAIGGMIIGSTAASAAPTFDFTDSAVAGGIGGTSYDITQGNIKITLSTVQGDLTFNDPFDGDVCPAVLECDGDGIGIISDEVQQIGENGDSQSLKVEFFDATTGDALKVLVESIAFLDMWIDNDDAYSFEKATLTFSNGPSLVVGAQEVEYTVGNSGGFVYFDVENNGGGAGKWVTYFTMTTPYGANDIDDGNNNAALAGLSVTAVPEPATWMMMLAGFVLVGTAMRRRQRHVIA